jgi:exopolysaccharide biosynthesis polyprenyl glycosylphosphotransferase
MSITTRTDDRSTVAYNRRRGACASSIVACADVLVALAGFLTLRDGGKQPLPDVWFIAPSPRDIAFVCTSILFASVASALGTDSVPGRGLGTALSKLVRLALAATFATVVAAAVSGSSAIASSRILGICVGLPLAAWLVRAVAQPRQTSRTLIVGAGHIGQHIYELSNRHAEQRIEVLGFIDDDPFELPRHFPPILGAPADLGKIAARLNVDRVIVAFTPRGDAELVGALRDCEQLGIRLDVVPRLFDLAKHEHGALGGLALFDASRKPVSASQEVAKRVFDVVGALVLLAILSPVMLVCAAAIRLDDRGPVFFRQSRVGRWGSSFRVWKFRTMSLGSEQAGLELIQGLSISDAVRALKHGPGPRVTRVGGFLRRTSLDELPQLFNVVAGTMSLVGPRPLRSFEIDALTRWQTVRLDVRPGITGLWQVLGRSEIDWEERMTLDYQYARHWSVSSDLSILARTVPAVLRRRGAL